MRILATRANEVCPDDRTSSFAGFRWRQHAHNREARILYSLLLYIVRSYVLRWTRVLQMTSLLLLNTEPSEAKAVVVKIGISLLPVTLSLPVCQQYEMPAPRVLQSSLQGFTQILNWLTEVCYVRWIQRAQTQISRVSANHKISAMLNTEIMQLLYEPQDVNTVIEVLTFCLDGPEDRDQELAIGPGADKRNPL